MSALALLKPSPLAQAVLAQCLGGNRLSQLLARRARRFLVRHGDPLVEIEVAGARLLAPLSHDLPLYQRNFPHYDTALPRLAGHLAAARGGRLAVVDVGANIGDSAAAVLAWPQTTVLAVEGSERFFRLLVANGRRWAERLTPLHSLLGERAEVVAASIDTSRGTGALRPGAGTATLRTLAAVIDEQPGFRAADLLKIDTDGFDIAILRGARPWLAQARPVLFFEFDPHFWRPITPDGRRVFQELAALGYGPLLIYDNFGWLAWTGSVKDARRLEELETWLSGRGSNLYVDVCLFPADAEASFEQFRAAELRYFAIKPSKGNLAPMPSSAAAA